MTKPARSYIQTGSKPFGDGLGFTYPIIVRDDYDREAAIWLGTEQVIIPLADWDQLSADIEKAVTAYNLLNGSFPAPGPVQYILPNKPIVTNIVLRPEAVTEAEAYAMECATDATSVNLKEAFHLLRAANKSWHSQTDSASDTLKVVNEALTRLFAVADYIRAAFRV